MCAPQNAVVWPGLRRWLYSAVVLVGTTLAGNGASGNFSSQARDATHQSQNEKQQAEGTPPPFHVDVHLALVEATVKNKLGRTMDDLTKDDFVVDDNGERQTISYLGRDQLPLAVALVVDISHSTDPYIGQLGYSTITALRALKPEDEVALFTFWRDVDCRVELTRNKGLISDSFESINFDQPGTNISRAVYYAAQYLKKNAGPAQRVIVLVSDDVPTDSDLPTEDVARAAIAANASVYNLKTAGDNSAGVQRRARAPDMIDVGKLTTATGGEIFDVNGKDDVLPAFQALIARLKTRYTIGFYPTDARATAPHKLDVHLQPQFGQSGKDYSITTSAGPHYQAEATASSGTVLNTHSEVGSGPTEAIGVPLPDRLLFRTLPFDRWLAEEERTQIPWKLDVRALGLSVYQRLCAMVKFQFDGQEIYKRGEDGDILFQVRFSDSAKHQFDFEGIIEVAKVYGPSLPEMKLTYWVDALVLPGTYDVSIVAYHTATRERTVAHRSVRVAPLANDPLPQLWRSFPPVEFVNDTRLPRAWFAPGIAEPFNVSVRTLQPIRVDVIAATGSDMWVIPALKIFSQISFDHGSAAAAVIDYGRSEVSFEQSDLHDLDWNHLDEGGLPGWEPRGPLTKDDAGFLRAELTRRLSKNSSGSAGTTRHVVVVLSGPTNFDHKADVSGIKLDHPCDCRVYMIRLPSWVDLKKLRDWEGIPLRDGDLAANSYPTRYLPDGLDKIMKPLNPKVFMVNSPMDFRRAFASLLADLSNM
jgi:VWFA-related protein